MRVSPTHMERHSTFFNNENFIYGMITTANNKASFILAFCSITKIEKVLPEECY